MSRLWQGVIAGLLVVFLVIAGAMAGQAYRNGKASQPLQDLAPVAQAQRGEVMGVPSAVNVPATSGGHTITVNGEGSVTVSPDVAYITLGVVTQASTSAAAAQENARMMSAVKAAMKAQGIADKDLRTTMYAIDPVYSQPSTGGATIVGYRVRNVLRVTVHTVSAAAQVLDAGTKAGANTNVSVSFGIGNPTPAQLQALGAAMEQAREKADALAKAADVQITGVVSIDEQSFSVPLPVTAMRAAAVASAPATPVEPGTQQVTARVVVVYAYK